MASRPNRPPRWISARELADFAYCRRSWGWRCELGEPSDPAVQARLAAGRSQHAAEGEARLAAEQAIRRGRWWWVWILLAALAAWFWLASH